jgi:hypothetical protein
LEEVLEVIASKWGLLGLGALLVISGPGRKVVRGAAKGLIKAGLDVSDSAREMVAEMKEQGSDLIAEINAERKEEQATQEAPKKEEAHTEKKSKKSAE